VERKFSQYIALSSALRRAKVPNYGACSNLLLECFLEDGGRLQASKAVAKKVCEEGRFSHWRDEMIRGGWLLWNQTQNDKGQYFSGKKLMPYLNKEKIFSKEIATKEEVSATRDEVADLRAQLNSHEERFTKIDAAVQELRRAVEPPDSEEKRKAREKIAERLISLSVTN